MNELPASLDFVRHLTPVHLRLFAVELSDAIKECALTEDFARLTELVEGWEATAEVDASPELQAELSRKKTYRPLSDLTT